MGLRMATKLAIRFHGLEKGDTLSRIARKFTFLDHHACGNPLPKPLIEKSKGFQPKLKSLLPLLRRRREKPSTQGKRGEIQWLKKNTSS
jgi:hypothetical protein